MSYEKRIIGFIDILGFGQLVYDSETDTEKLTLIQQVLKELKEVDDIYGSPGSFFAHSNYEYLSHDFKEELNAMYEAIKADATPSRVIVTTFSDSIVFSCPASADGLSNFRYFLIKLLVRTSSFKLLLRGGVSCGPLFHSEQFIFGPAMNNAYHTESKIAKNPRIATDDNFLELLTSLESENVVRILRSELIRDTTDGVTYFNNLSLATNKVAQNMCGANAYEILANEKETIESLLNSTPDDPRVRDKIDWYTSYFNQYIVENPEVEVVISEFQGLPMETIVMPVLDLKIQARPCIATSSMSE